jgi:hypothetical protein
MKFHCEPQSFSQLVWLATDDSTHHPHSLVQPDDGRGVRDLKPRIWWSPHNGPAIEPASPRTVLPSRYGLVALRTDVERAEPVVTACRTALVKELMLTAAVPVRLTPEAWPRSRNPFGLGKEVAHGRSWPKSRTSQNRAPDPPLEHRATSAPATWFVSQSPRSCMTARMTRCSCCALIPG